MDLEGTKFCCSPPPRDKAGQEAVWRGLSNGTFQVFSSDHAPYRYRRYRQTAERRQDHLQGHRQRRPRHRTARAACCFPRGSGKGRIDLNRFVALTATNAAKIYGLYPKKGTIAVGSDADIAIWDPERQVTVRAGYIHDNVGYTPYEGMHLTGWPVTVLSRGRIVIDDGKLVAERGSGNFLPCALSDAAKPLGRTTRNSSSPPRHPVGRCLTQRLKEDPRCPANCAPPLPSSVRSISPTAARRSSSG